MTDEFWITTAAIFLGPLFAVLITYFLQKRNESKQRQLSVFKALMTTRRTPLSPERVQALNLVEVEFYNELKVQKKFSLLLKAYNDRVRWTAEDEETRKQVIQEVDDRTAELLREMGAVLGYKLENLDLLRGGYYPEAFSIRESQQTEILEFLVGLNNGSKALPTAVLDVRHPHQILDEARNAQRLMQTAANLEAEQE